MSEDPKVKKAVRKIEVSPLLGIDSPMVIWQVGSLEGITSTELEGGLPMGGGGGSPGGEPAPSATFVVICNDVFHAPDVLGALPNGAWVGNVHETEAPAFNEATAHNGEVHDGIPHANVFMSIGATLVGPLRQF